MMNSLVTGAVIGVVIGMTIVYVPRKLKLHAIHKARQAVSDTRRILQGFQAPPRTMLQISRGVEPEWVRPVIAHGGRHRAGAGGLSRWWAGTTPRTGEQVARRVYEQARK